MPTNWPGSDLSNKFGHSERTQSKTYCYLAHNSLPIEAVEAIEKAEKKRASLNSLNREEQGIFKIITLEMNKPYVLSWKVP